MDAHAAGPRVYDATACDLGEGPMWHPERQALFWFDILGKRLLSRTGDATRVWRFAEHVSAAGWVDRDRLLIASETSLSLLNLASGTGEEIAPLDADDPTTRSNDGRADPWGGFWISTMGKRAAPGAGAFWRYYRGEVRRLLSGVTIPNAICFAPDGGCAYLTDTRVGTILRQRLDPRHGWPAGEPEAWLDLGAQGLNPDGAVCDAEGNFWNAQWGAGRVACYDTQGALLHVETFPARQTSCPAFGGDIYTTLYCTSARDGLSAADLEAEPEEGRTFAVDGLGPGRSEPRVVL